MNSSDSSEDECNMYVNAASKLNALNHQDKRRIKELKDDDDLIFVGTEILNKNVANDSQTKDIDPGGTNLKRSEQEKSIQHTDSLDNLILVNDMSNNEASNRRITRSMHNTVSNVLKSANPLDDSIEAYLNATIDDSFQLSQNENDSYVIIGSPPPSKKVEIDNYEVSIKVLWKSNKLERFELKRHETFQKVFRHFASLEGVPEDQILITKKDKHITSFETPASIDWSIIDILEGGVVNAEIVQKNKTTATKGSVLENICKIKVQTSDKKTLTISVNNNDLLTDLVHKCSEQLNVPESKMKFYFDGELIDTDYETPKSLDLDYEACIDLKISK